MKNTNYKISFITLIILFILPPIQSQVKETRDIGKFTNIYVSGGIDLIIEQGDKIHVMVEAKNDKMLETIITELEGTTLKVYSKKTRFIRGSRVVYITMDDIEAIKASGGSDVKTTSVIKSDDLIIKATGGSDLYMNIEAGNLVCKVSGGSDAKLSGNANTLEVRASGGSDVKAGNFESNIGDVEASGGSDVHVKVSKEISIEAGGGSDVYYYGNPQIKSINSGGGSDVHKR